MAGIEARPPAQQASAPSITAMPLGGDSYSRHYLSMVVRAALHWAIAWQNIPNICFSCSRPSCRHRSRARCSCRTRSCSHLDQWRHDLTAWHQNSQSSLLWEIFQPKFFTWQKDFYLVADIAQKESLRFSTSCPRFDSWHSQIFILDNAEINQQRCLRIEMAVARTHLVLQKESL